ncbi:MAG: ComF family protein [Alteraurantiacibacter sp.]
MLLKQALGLVIDLVYPPRCPACGAAIASHGALCQDCWAGLVIPGEPCCTACQRPFGNEDMPAGSLCAPCLADPPLHDGIAAATLYNDTARKLVLAFKHGHRIALSRLLSRQMLARLPVLEDDWLVVPVPLHRRRLWQRGFNQSALLAREIAEARGLALLVDGLLRIRATPPLGKLGRKERARVLKGAIGVNPPREAQLKGAQVLLVDDVMTSGATTGACLAVLRKAGAARVRIACFSRVLDEAL